MAAIIGAVVLIAVSAAINRYVDHRAEVRREQAALSRQVYIYGVLHAALERHGDALQLRLFQLLWKDAYGNWITDKWRSELDYFYDFNVRPNLPEDVTAQEERELREKLHADWDFSPAEIAEWVESIASLESADSDTRNDGLAFERRVGSILAQAGYSISFTPATGDQGVDLIAKRGAECIAVQCKDYRAPVGNDAVQQVFSGGAFYRAQRCVVVAPQGFTTSARQLASSLDVICVGPAELVAALRKEPLTHATK